MSALASAAASGVVAPLRSSRQLWRVMGALTLLAVYISVVLLAFTSSKASAPSLGAAEFMHRAGDRSSAPDRTFVTTLYAEHQLPALIALAHSLARVGSVYGLLLLLPTGRHGKEAHHHVGHTDASSRRRGGNGRRRSTRVSAAAAEAEAEAEEVPHAWSAASLAIMRSIPNVRLHPLPHIQFPPPPSLHSSGGGGGDDDARAAFSAAAHQSSSVSFTSAVRTLLLLEVWRLTEYKQVLYLDVATLLSENIDHLLRVDFEHAPGENEQHAPAAAAEEEPHAEAELHDSADADSPPQPVDFHRIPATPEDDAQLEARRRGAIDAGLERFIHSHTRTGERSAFASEEEANEEPSFSPSAKELDLRPVQWTDSYAALTPAYMQMAAPLHLVREDCARHEEIAAKAATGSDADAAAAADSTSAPPAAAAPAAPPAVSPSHTPALHSSLALSVFSGNLLLLVPHSYTYHLLLQHYTSTHVERRDRFDASHTARKEDRRRYANLPTKIANNFFAHPCAASVSGSAASMTPRSIAFPHDSHSGGVSNPLATPSTGCWHPLSLNFSLTSHSCSCADGERFPAVTRYASCDGGEINPWNMLQESTTDMMRRVDQLAMKSGRGGDDAEKGKHRPVAAKVRRSRRGNQERRALEESAESAEALADKAAAGAAHGDSQPAAPPSPAAAPTPAAPRSSSSLLSWLGGSSSSPAAAVDDGDSSLRYSMLYLREQEARAMETLDAMRIVEDEVTAAAEAGHGDAAHDRETEAADHAPPAQFLSPCCHRQYARVLRTYFAALHLLRPQFEEPTIATRKSRHG